MAAGACAIIGTFQPNMGVYLAINDAGGLTATITTAHPTLPRIDLVCLTVTDAAYIGGTINQVAVNVIAGTPNASPVAPSTPTNSIAICTVAVAANATSIVNANITDLRTRCSIVGQFNPRVVSSSQNVVAFDALYVNTSAPVTLTGPATASLDDEIRIWDATGQANINNITFNSNGLKINGVVQNYVVDKANFRSFLKYTGATNGWMVY